MIIHHKEDIKSYQIICQKKLKYLDDFSFIPIKIVRSTDKSDPGIFQTPLLFTPYGIQNQHNKTTIDLSFMNKDNDPLVESFYNTLLYIYDFIHTKYKDTYTVNPFMKHTMFNEMIRLKVNSRLLIFDQQKQPIDTIPPFSYGCFMMNLHGLWISDKDIWFQWYLNQGKIIEPISLAEYGFIDDIIPTPALSSDPQTQDKYDKMLKMGVPKEAVDRQRQLDQPGNVPPPLKSGIPPPPPLPHPTHLHTKSKSPLMISSSDLINVKLKQTKTKTKDPSTQDTQDRMDVPSLSDILQQLQKLKPIQ